jgi:hypothetical protein
MATSKVYHGVPTDSVVITDRVVHVTFTKALNAHQGAKLLSLGGSALSPKVPDGYTFVGNVNIALNGLIGVFALFDGANQYKATSVTPYVYNASDANYSAGSTCDVHLFSLCIK